MQSKSLIKLGGDGLELIGSHIFAVLSGNHCAVDQVLQYSQQPMPEVSKLGHCNTPARKALRLLLKE